MTKASNHGESFGALFRRHIWLGKVGSVSSWGTRAASITARGLRTVKQVELRTEQLSSPSNREILDFDFEIMWPAFRHERELSHKMFQLSPCKPPRCSMVQSCTSDMTVFVNMVANTVAAVPG